MRAVRFHQYGDPQVLTLGTLQAPRRPGGSGPTPGTSVNPVDWKIRAGYLHEVLPVAFLHPGQRRRRRRRRGRRGVSDVQIGDAVVGLAQGGAAGDRADRVGARAFRLDVGPTRSRGPGVVHRDGWP